MEPRASSFIQKMTSTAGSIDHSMMLSVDELKLVKEWLDIGAQNFNDPFDVAAPL